jgi:hypothetical protein
VREADLDVPGFQGFLPVAPFDGDVDDETETEIEAAVAVAKCWADPIADGNAVNSSVEESVAACRFSFSGCPADAEAEFEGSSARAPPNVCASRSPV